MTGWGMVSPNGGTVDDTFAACAAGRSGIRELRLFDPAGFPCRIAGQVEDRWITADGDGPPGVTSRPSRLLLTAARQAAAMADLAEFPDRSRVCVVVGGHAGSASTEDIGSVAALSDDEGRVDAERLSRHPDYPFHLFDLRRADHGLAIVARDVDARGLLLPIVSACAAGAQAIGEATRLLREGRADAVVAGGAESYLSYAGFVGFVLLGALVKRYPSPEKASRPFDRRRNGFVMSEGSGIVILETLASARARGRRVLGEVLGYGDSADAYRITDVHPDAEGAYLAITRAMADAGVSPGEVEYVNAHGTSTPTNDPVETLGIKRALGEERARAVPVSSNKSMIGHTIGAAGAIEAILTWKGIEQGVLLPTINYETPDPKCDLDYVPNAARHVPHRIALSNSFGFGGQNACLCLGAPGP